jgi:hypothetical protein
VSAFIPNEFIPYAVEINSISNAQKAVIGFVEDHAFTLGENVSIRSSQPYGMTEINNLVGHVIDLTSDSITVDIDTTNFRPFVYPPVGKVVFVAMAVPASSGIIPNYYPPTVTLEDAFDNVPTV